MKLKMTIDEALAFADEWSRGMTLHEDAQGWRVVCMLLAEEVRAKRDAAVNADKLRLDWLADRDNNIGNVQLPTMCVMNNLHSLRGAIDEAMRLDPEIWAALGGADAGETFNAV